MNSRDQARLRRVSADVLGLEIDDIEGETDFYEDLNLDRSDVADLVVAVEDAFDISIDTGLEELRTFDDLEGLVDDLVPA